MQNKQKPIISIEDIPIIVTVAVLVVGFGTIFGLIAYSIFGINQYAKPAIKTPSISVIGSNYFGNEFIQVKSPQRNATIKSPVLISGKANVFEANVRIRIKDSNENILADTFITAQGAYDKLYPFEKEIEYLAPSSQNGFMEVFEESAKDGSDLRKVAIPVVFGDYADVLDWQTYRNEEYGFEIKYPQKYESDDTDYSIWIGDKGAVGLLNAWGVNKGQEGIFAVEVYPKANESAVLNHFKYKTIDKQGLSVGGIAAKRLKGASANNDLIIEKENYIYIILSSFSAADSSNQEYNEYNQILSTFKFIEK